MMMMMEEEQEQEQEQEQEEEEGERLPSSRLPSKSVVGCHWHCVAPAAIIGSHSHK